MHMFFLGTTAAKTAPEFVPDDDSRGFIADTLSDLLARLGPSASEPRVLTPPRTVPRDLDSLFDMVCAVQGEVGQGEVEFTLLETNGESEPLPDDFRALGPPEGKMLMSAFGRGEYVLLYTPAVFVKRELLFAAVAREIGRMTVHRTGEHVVDDVADFDTEAELAAVGLGLGVLVVNGSYVFDNACCGGGCGVDLKGLRAGLTMPEATYATAIDGHRRGLARRVIARHLEPTQRVAFKHNWSHVGREGMLALAAGAAALPSRG